MTVCIACGHSYPQALWGIIDVQSGAMVCYACRSLAEGNRGPCSDSRGCLCVDGRP